MSISSIGLIISIIINSFLGIFVYRKGEEGRIRTFFSLFAISVVLWSVALLFFTTLSNPELVALSGKVAHIAGAGVGLFLLYFVLYFPYQRLYKKSFILKYLPPFPFLMLVYLLIFSDKIVGPAKELNGLNYYEIGDFYIVYSVFIVLYFLIAYIDLAVKFFQSKGITKAQTEFLFFGIAVSATLGIITNLILPALEIIKYNWVGPAGTFIMVGFFSYAILKHHLLNIKVIATEAFSVAISIFLLINSLLAETVTEFVLKFGLFCAVAFFSYLLIRGVMREIEARERIVRISNDLKDANTELKRLDKAKSEFLSIASHQLRTPLTAIKGYSSMLLDNDYGEIPKESKKIVEKIFLSSKRLTMIVDDFLDVSRIEAGEMRYDIHKFNLKETVKNIVDDFVVNNPKARDLNLQFSWEDKDYTIQNDQNKIAQIISNIIDNSIKYTPKGHAKVYLSKNEGENKFLIKVEDTGVGISKETLARLFQKFTRAQEISKLHTDGSGLGLYVAKRIIEDLHGKIRAESAGEGKGSIFFIELPVS